MKKDQIAVASPYILKDSDLIMTSDNESNFGHSASGLVQNARQYVLRIRDLPDNDKPREKMLATGPSGLTMPELLAVILNSGNTKEGVLEMSNRIVREYGTNALMNHTDPQKLSNELDIPIIKACQVVAIGELGRRLYQRNENGLTIIRNANDAYEYLHDMRNLPKEQMRGIYLDTHNRVIHDEVIAIGTVNSNVTHPREVFRPALEYNAAALILAHNHPSGIAEPSKADIEITKQLIEAGKIIGVHILDHVIISKDGFKSIEADY
jgi:DNA repair protein RadC